MSEVKSKRKTPNKRYQSDQILATTVTLMTFYESSIPIMNEGNAMKGNALKIVINHMIFSILLFLERPAVAFKMKFFMRVCVYSFPWMIGSLHDLSWK